MHIPRLSLLPPLLRELFSRRTLRREPEPSLVMEDPAEVDAYTIASRGRPLAGVYLFTAAHITRSIHGCKRVLDLGCGPGTILCDIAALNPSIRFVGIDLSPTMLETAASEIRRRGLENVSVQKGDMTKLPDFPPASFDGVISSFALHHLPTHGDLEKCFSEIQRLLCPGGAVFLFDFCRLKTVQSVVYMAYLTAADEPYILTLDKERSMRAAFTFDDFKRLASQHPGGLEIHGTYGVPLIAFMRTPARPVPSAMLSAFKSRLESLPSEARAELEDLRFFFRLDGVTDDPFGSFVPLAGQWGKLRMLDFATLPVVGALHTSRAARTVRIVRLVVRMSLLFVRMKAQCLWKPSSSKKYRRQFLSRLALLLKKDLGALKGPIMKFGQMASYLSEDLPPAFQRTLRPLQNRTPPLAPDIVRQTVERALGRPIKQIFELWYDTPIAAASVSQLHLARLPEGRWVVVKVRYPGLLRAVKADFFLLKCLSPLLSRLWGLPNVGELLKELETLITTECDFCQAGAFQEEFRRAFRDDPDMIIPRVYTDLTTPDVMTMDYVEGLTYDEFKQKATQDQKNRAGEIIWRMAAVSINRFGLYNADPHPGNYLFVDDKVAFIDFGFTKRFSPAFMALWKEQSLAGCAGDIERFREANQRLGYERRGRRMDHGAMFDTYRKVVYQAWMEDRNFRFTREFVQKEIHSLLALHRGSRGALRMPTEFVAILRLLWGQHVLLADLGAESNWHRIVFPLLKEPFTPTHTNK